MYYARPLPEARIFCCPDHILSKLARSQRLQRRRRQRDQPRHLRSPYSDPLGGINIIALIDQVCIILLMVDIVDRFVQHHRVHMLVNVLLVIVQME